KFKDYSCSFVAKMRAAFFIMAFSSSRSLILSSNSFSRLRCSLGVTNSSSSAFNCCSSLYLVQLSIKYSCFLTISPTPIKVIYWSLQQNHDYLNRHTLYNTSCQMNCDNSLTVNYNRASSLCTCLMVAYPPMSHVIIIHTCLRPIHKVD